MTLALHPSAGRVDGTSLARARTLPNDAALPQLATLLQASTMATHFARALGTHGVRVEACEVERVKYRPRRNCSVLYRLALRDACGQAWLQPVALRSSTLDDARRRVERVDGAARARSRAGPSVSLIDEVAAAAWWWPNDEKLRAPALLSDGHAMRTRVLVDLARDWRVDADVHSHVLRVAQYVPEQRVTADVRIQWPAGVPADVPRHVYVKASRGNEGPAVQRLLHALCRQALARDAVPCTPVPLGWQPTHGLHWQSALPGVPWFHLDERSRLACLPALGAQLAALHACEAGVSRTLNVAVLQSELDEVVTLVRDACPETAGDLMKLQHVLSAWLPSLASAPRGTLHGDLHPGNVLVHGSTVSLIDLDGAREGPVVLELGAWMADGWYRALLVGASVPSSFVASRALLTAYTTAAGVLPTEGDVARAAAWALLVQRVRRCVLNLKPGRFVLVPSLVAAAARVAARGLEAA